MNIPIRPRRNRQNAAIRNLIAETELNPSHLVFPLFLQAGPGTQTEVTSMPGQFRYGPDLLLKEIESCLKLGIKAFALFPVIEDRLKDAKGKESLNKNGLLPQTLKKIKDKLPEALIITDVALDPFSSDGHDGIVENGKILNDASLEVLADMALIQAEAGADFVAPSDMMDGRVGYIRKILDESNFTETGILSYSAKFASSFYGPFRDALSSAPKFGDKKTYQMDYRNRIEALREVRLDIAEGADIVMVKPALPFLDIIREVKNAVDVPVAAYNVSGEYAMIKAAAKAGMIDGTKAMIESLYSIRRAGADLVFTYFAKEFATDFASRS